MKNVIAVLVALVVIVISSTAAHAQYTDLLKNRSLHHWMTQSGENVDKGWAIESDGTLHLDGDGGHIITRQMYCDFELWFEFRISTHGNSGIKYRVKKYGDSLLGCEYQILDDDTYPGWPQKQLTASLYDVFDPMANPTRRLTGDAYNIGKVLVQGNRIRHWINGQLTIDECTGTRRWNDAIASSKFTEKERFGQNRFGHIMLTDHHSEVWYRNVFIRSR